MGFKDLKAVKNIDGGVLLYDAVCKYSRHCRHLPPWRWKQYISLKYWCPPTRSHSVQTQNTNMDLCLSAIIVKVSKSRSFKRTVHVASIREKSNTTCNKKFWEELIYLLSLHKLKVNNIQCHHLHTKFHPNSPIVSKDSPVSEV
jgi:hypothetical protein